ncbi:MAG TPA: tetratricopeptide repeat protein [Candidatus Xenobia bacterium]|jgi:hypothetical protein
MKVAAVHLVWKPLGFQYFQRFITSYRNHPAGHDHELIVIFNGFDKDDALDEYEADMSDIPHRSIRLSHSKRDLSAYYEVAQSTDHEWYCFLNSYSKIMGDLWLGHLVRAGTQPGVGMAGATGSWDSLATHRVLLTLDSTDEMKQDSVLHYPAFPNYHLRTTGILVRRDRWLGYEPFRDLVDKEAAHRCESGKDGFSQTLLKQGLELLVVGRDGRTWPHARWHESGTFRTGDQENCLIWDNLTERYKVHSLHSRAQQREATWGVWTKMRDWGTWSPMELVRQMDICLPWAHPQMFLPLLWCDSGSDEKLSAALRTTTEWWQELGLPARIEKDGPPMGAHGVIRQGSEHEARVWLGGAPGTDWLVKWDEPFPTLTTRHGRLVGKPLAFLLCDAALRLRDRTLHQIWKSQRRPLSRTQAEGLVRNFPERAESALLMAGACEAERVWDEAAAWYRKSLEFDAGYADGHLGLARCLMALGQPAEARAPIERALQIKPFDTRGWRLKWQAGRA